MRQQPTALRTKSNTYHRSWLTPYNTLSLAPSLFIKLTPKKHHSDSDFPTDHSLTHFLELVSAIPFEKFSPSFVNIASAKKALDDTHFGMSEVKESILSLIMKANRKQSASEMAPILLVGPPGTGKTTIAESIANAMERPFIHIAGVNDAGDLIVCSPSALYTNT